MEAVMITAGQAAFARVYATTEQAAFARAHARPVIHAKMLAGIEDYLFIGGDRMSQRQAAERLGVTMRTICRYRAYLRGIGAA
jgi:hypothetical protein